MCHEQWALTVIKRLRFFVLIFAVFLPDFILQYGGVKVVKSVVKSDHCAVIAFSGDVIRSINKSRRVCTYRKHTAAQHARFLASAPDVAALAVNPDGNPQEEFDRIHNVMLQIPDDYYPVRTITITSADPPECLHRMSNLC